MKKNIAAMAGLLVLVAAVRPDLSWGQIGFGPGQSMDPGEALKEARASEIPAAGAPGTIPTGPAAGNNLSAGQPGVPVEWVSISGGKFAMGTDDEDGLFQDAKPVHEVAIKDFKMSKTLVTVEQYAECYKNGKGPCTKPGIGDTCNWGQAGRQRHPINCVDWYQANRYAKFKGARLPSESEWEYAARSGGKNQKYPWGDENATCELAVMNGKGGYGCGSNGTMPVLSEDGKECAKKAGQTEQGLCDMAGNVWELVRDAYQNSYAGAPTNGSAFEGAWDRVIRGGSWGSDNIACFRAAYRGRSDPTLNGDLIGFRIAR